MAADVNKTVQISLKAKTGPLVGALKSLPDVTSSSAKKMVKSLDKAFDKIDKKARDTAKSAKESFSNFTKGAGGAALAIGGAGAALLGFSKHLADATNQLNDASVKSGISAQNLHGLKVAAEGAGLEFGVLEAGLDKFPAKMMAAAQGSKTAQLAFSTLGVEIKNADGSLKDANQVFEDSIKGLSGIENEAERAALAQQLFGRSGAALIQSGAIQGLEAFNDLTREFGISLGPQASASSADMQRAISELSMVAEGTFQKILNAFAGGGEAGDGINNLIEGATKGIVYFGVVGQDALAFLSQMAEHLMSNFFVLTALLDGDTGRAMAMINDMNQETAKAVSNLANTFERAGEEVEKFTELSDKSRKAAGTGAGGGAGGRAASMKMATKEQEKQIDLAGKQAELDQMASQAMSDQRDAQDQILQTYQEQLERIQEIAEETNGQVDTETARLELKARMERDLYELQMEQITEMNEKREEAHQEELERIAKERDDRIQAIQQYGTAVTGYLSDFSSALTSTLTNTGAMTEETAKKIHALNQATAVADIAINTAVAIMKAYSTLGPVGGALATGALTALAALQTAAVLTQPPPSFHMGGMVGDNDRRAPDQVSAQLLTGEAVLDRATVRRIGGEKGVRSMQRGGQVSPSVVVVSPYKHFDRFLAGSMRSSTRLRGLVRQPRGMRGH